MLDTRFYDRESIRMENETSTPPLVEVEIPPPYTDTKPRDWRNPPPALPFGHQILNQVDPSRSSLFPDQQRKILAIQSEEALKAMLYADLGNTDSPDIMTAERVFGDLLKRDLEIPSLLMTWKAYTLSQAMLMVEDGRTMSKDKSLSGAERVKAYQIQGEGIRCLIQITDRLTKLATKIGVIRSVGKKKKPIKEVRVLRPAPSLTPVERISV